MPRYISINGVWHPATKFTKRELEAMGVKTLGHKVEDSSIVTEAPVEGEEEIKRSKDKESRGKLKKILHKRGIKSRKARPRM